MIWILAMLCLGVFTTLGWLRGPVRALFALAGLVVGAAAAVPGGVFIKPVFASFFATRPLLLLLLPPLLVFLVVLAVFVILGNKVHRKVFLRQKYGREEVLFSDWEKAFQLAGLGAGAWVGAAVFFLLLAPVYSAGYFATQFYPRNDGPAWTRIVQRTFSDIQTLKLDGALGLFHPVPNSVYETADIKEYLLTGQSANYASGLVGFWRIDLNATFALARAQLTNASASGIVTERARVKNAVADAVLTATEDNQFVLKQGAGLVARGSWKKTDSGDYHATPQGSLAEFELSVNGNQLILAQNKSYTMVFARQL